jgi:Uncharacterised MFS-type transporter YbfB
MATLRTCSDGTLKSGSSPWIVVGQVAAALATGMGIGRFVYTPILPLMVAQAHLTAQLGGVIATANYAGYLAGAMAGIFLPRLLQSKVTLRISLVVLVLALATMPITENSTNMVCPATHRRNRQRPGVHDRGQFHADASSSARQSPHRVGLWRLGAGIALSGILVLALRSISNWSVAWIASAILAAVLSSPAWTLKTQQPAASPVPSSSQPSTNPAPDGSAAELGYSLASRPCRPPRYGPGSGTGFPGQRSCSPHSWCKRSASRFRHCSAEWCRRSSLPSCSAQRSLVSERSPSPSEST